MSRKLSGLFISFCRSGDAGVAQVGDEGLEFLLRLSSIRWPGLESPEGSHGVGVPTSQLLPIPTWLVSAGRKPAPCRLDLCP